MDYHTVCYIRVVLHLKALWFNARNLDVGKTPKVTESEQATIDAVEDDQEDVEEHLDAFDPDESAGGVNADQEERQFEDVPLYDGAPISMAVSMLLIVRDLNLGSEIR